MHTIYITTGYRWEQNAKTVTLYLRIPGANENDYTLDIQSRSIDLGINSDHGIHYKFKISKLCGQLEAQGTEIKFDKNKVTIHLQKKEYGKHWNDIKTKSIHEVYSQMQRKIDQGEYHRSTLKTGNNGSVNDFDNQQELVKEILGNSDPSTWQADTAKLLSNQQARSSDFAYSLDPFQISDTILPSTSPPCPHSQAQAHEKHC